MVDVLNWTQQQLEVMGAYARKDYVPGDVLAAVAYLSVPRSFSADQRQRTLFFAVRDFVGNRKSAQRLIGAIKTVFESSSFSRSSVDPLAFEAGADHIFTKNPKRLDFSNDG